MFYTPTPNHEDYILEIGDKFAASPVAPYRGDFIVLDRYEQAGYRYYVATPAGKHTKSETSGLVFRNKDIGNKIVTPDPLADTGRIIVTNCAYKGKQIGIAFGETGAADRIFQLVLLLKGGWETLDSKLTFPTLPAARQYVESHFKFFNEK